MKKSIELRQTSDYKTKILDFKRLDFRFSDFRLSDYQNKILDFKTLDFRPTTIGILISDFFSSERRD